MNLCRFVDGELKIGSLKVGSSQPQRVKRIRFEVGNLAFLFGNLVEANSLKIRRYTNSQIPGCSLIALRIVFCLETLLQSLCPRVPKPGSLHLPYTRDFEISSHPTTVDY
ncbi:hypothetical protein VTL71DRAFT_3956 [Oculimacula yallundae]|uniref:Uncharacterized protein n=1 Tax=Oculimacula yallundae TaxID=86028 RepID=A0ABR4C648_9HELO